MMQTHFGQFHPEVEELQRLSDAPVTEQNAENFLVFLDKAFPNKSWENHDLPKGIVESYLGKLDSIQDAWSDEISDEINNSNLARGALISSLTPQNRPNNRPQTNVSDHGIELNQNQYEAIAKRVLGSNIPHKNDREVFYFQTYFNEIHRDNQHVSVDGLVGSQTLGIVDTHLIATKIFLNELGASLELTDTIDSDTEATLKEYFGMDFEATLAQRATQAVQEEYDRIHAMSDSELQAALDEANTRQPEKENDKRAYMSEFVRRYKENGISVVPNSTNEYILTDIAGNPIANSHTQEDLQSMMILLSVNGNDIFKENMLKENIANNIFDYVVEEFSLEKSDGSAWQAGDFEKSNLVTEVEAQANKTTCSEQIQAEITKLREENSKDTTNHSQRQSNILMIQKLEIAKIFVQDRTRISSDSLEFARSVTDDREEIARALGVTEDDMVRIYGQIEGGDMQSLGKSMIFPLILALIGGAFSRLLPEGFLRTAFQGSILGLLGLKFASEANERGYGITRPGDVSGTNDPVVEGSDVASSYQEALNAILTNAPAGLESRHKMVYAKLVKYNNETPGSLDSREKVDTTFLVLSQDPVFKTKNKSELTDIDAAKARTLVSDETANFLNEKGITDDEIKIFLRMLVEVSKGETQDVTVGDMFVDGKESNEGNLVSVTWVAGESFSKQNKEINTQVSLLSGMSFGVDSALRGDSVRADVEEILGKAEPGFTAWITAGVLEQVGMEDWNVTHPSITNVDTVISELTAISNRSGISSSDKAAITAIITEYTAIKTTLEATQKVDTYLSEASAVYSITGSAVGLGEDVINWVRGFGDPVPTTTNTSATTAEIDAMISEGENLANNGAYADRKDDILTVVENLRLYRINRLDEVANDDSLSQVERDAASTASDGILKSAVEANLALYTTTLESIKQDTISLTQEHTSTTGYLRALTANKENLAVLARLKDLGVSASINGESNTFNTDANNLYAAVFTNGVVKNFTAYVANQETKLAAIDTTTSVLDTREEVEKAESDFAKIQQELVMTGVNIDILSFFGLVHEDYDHTIGGDTGANIVLAMANLFSKVEGSPITISFDPDTLNTKYAEISARRRDVIGDLEDDKIENITVAGTPVTWTDIDVSNDNHITALISTIEQQEESLEGLDRTTLDNQIKEVVAMFVAKIPTGIDQAASDTLEDLKDQYDRFEEAVGNAGDNSFEEAFDSKVESITKHELEEKLKIMTLDEAGDKVQSMIDFIVVYKDYGNVQEEIILQFGNNNIDTSTATVYDFLELIDRIGNLSSLQRDDSTTANVDESVPLPDGFQAEAQLAIRRTIEHINGNRLLELTDLVKGFVDSGVDTFNLLFK